MHPESSAMACFGRLQAMSKAPLQGDAWMLGIAPLNPAYVTEPTREPRMNTDEHRRNGCRPADDVASMTR